MNFRKMIIVVCCAFLFAPTVVSAQSADDIKFMTENYPPFNFKEGGKLQGIAVDLIDTVLKKMKSGQSKDDIQLLPWARGYKNTLEKKNTCLFATTRTEEREDKFKWVGPISPTTISLLARKDKGITLTSTADAKKFKIGVAINDIGEQLLVKAGLDLKKLDRTGGTNVLDSLINKLKLKRIDLLAYEENVVKWEIKKKGLNPEDYQTVHVLKKGELFYAFHKSTPDALINQFQKALEAVKKDGTYQKILDSYLK